MADIVGVDGIHNIKGLRCDFCGRECDSKVEELNFLSEPTSFAQQAWNCTRRTPRVEGRMANTDA